MNEIPFLFPVGDSFLVGLEKGHLSGFWISLESVEDRGGHAPLVALVRPVNVEKLQAPPLGRGGFLLQGPKVELVFASAINVQGFVTVGLPMVVE